MGEGFKVCIADTVLNVDKVCSSISDFVDKEVEDSIKRSNYRYENHSFTFDLNISFPLDDVLLEIIYGDAIRKTTDRLNGEWLEKMWKASDDDFLAFRLEQIHKKFEELDESDEVKPGFWRCLNKACELI